MRLPSLSNTCISPSRCCFGCSFFITSLSKRLFNKERIILKAKAHQKLATLNPSPKIQSAINMMEALITNKNKPSVNNVNGNVKNTSKGFTETFSSTKTAANKTALPQPSICTPEDNNNDAITTASEFKNNLMIKFIGAKVGKQ